jgi:probable rRNA maturation factor
MISVLITSESRYKIERPKIRQAATSLLKNKKLDDVEVGISVVGSRKIKQLNRDFREVDEMTDVLAFPLEEPRGPDEILRLGEVIVCYPLARQQAARENKLVSEKVIELIEHGLRHLIGEHHE